MNEPRSISSPPEEASESRCPVLGARDLSAVLAARNSGKHIPGDRHEDWPQRLHEFIESRRRTAFDWESNNCCFFACDGILTITGLDPAAGMFREVCHGALDAARLVRKHGGVEAIAEAQCEACGFPEVPVLLAQRGDVLLMDVDRKYRPVGSPGAGFAAQAVAGICIGTHGAFAGPKGLEFMPLAQCRRAWAVGRAVAGPNKGGPN